MASPLASVALGTLLGLSLAVPPGAVNALILREATRHGAWAGVRAGLPAPVLDTAYLLLVLFGLGRLLEQAEALPYLAAAGGLLMAYLAWDTARLRAAGPAPPVGAWAAATVTLTNPFQYAWWLSAGAAFLAALGAWGAVGFVAAVFGWVVAFSHLVAHGAMRWGWFAPAMTLLAADLLVAFAAVLAATGAGL